MCDGYCTCAPSGPPATITAFDAALKEYYTDESIEALLDPYEERLKAYGSLMYGPFGPPDPPEDTLPMGLPAPKPPSSKPTHERLEEDRKDGSVCCKCGEWYPMAEPNITEDGQRKFKCWCCRQDPFR